MGFLTGLIVGMFIAVCVVAILIQFNPYISNIFLLKDDCNVMLRQTCDTVNSVIDLSNSQGVLLERCFNNTLPKLTKLSCEKLL